jgi:aspartyl protease family protein
MEEGARTLYLVLLLAALMGSFLISARGRWGEVWRAARLWGVIVAVIVLLAAFRSDLERIGQRVMAQLNPSAGAERGDTILFAKQEDGHFWLSARVNGVPVRFMLDTGASTVVLTRADADRIGLDVSALDFSQRASTANGLVATAPVVLETLSIGSFARTRVQASVNGGALPVSLLGMTLLSEFGAVRIEGDTLALSH